MVDLADSKVLNPNPNPKRHNRNHRPYGTPFRTGSKLPSLNPSPVHTWSFIRPAKTVSLSLSSDHTWQLGWIWYFVYWSSSHSPTILIDFQLLGFLISLKMVFCLETVWFSAAGGWKSEISLSVSLSLRWRLHLLSSSSGSWFFPSSYGWSSCESSLYSLSFLNCSSSSSRDMHIP